MKNLFISIIFILNCQSYIFAMENQPPLATLDFSDLVSKQPTFKPAWERIILLTNGILADYISNKKPVDGFIKSAVKEVLYIMQYLHNHEVFFMSSLFARPDLPFNHKFDLFSQRFDTEAIMHSNRQILSADTIIEFNSPEYVKIDKISILNEEEWRQLAIYCTSVIKIKFIEFITMSYARHKILDKVNKELSILLEKKNRLHSQLERWCNRYIKEKNNIYSLKLGEQLKKHNPLSNIPKTLGSYRFGSKKDTFFRIKNDDFSQQWRLIKDTIYDFYDHKNNDEFVVVSLSDKLAEGKFKELTEDDWLTLTLFYIIKSEVKKLALEDIAPLFETILAGQVLIESSKDGSNTNNSRLEEMKKRREKKKHKEDKANSSKKIEEKEIPAIGAKQNAGKPKGGKAAPTKKDKRAKKIKSKKEERQKKKRAEKLKKQQKDQTSKKSRTAPTKKITKSVASVRKAPGKDLARSNNNDKDDNNDKDAGPWEKPKRKKRGNKKKSAPPIKPEKQITNQVIQTENTSASSTESSAKKTDELAQNKPAITEKTKAEILKAQCATLHALNKKCKEKRNSLVYEAAILQEILASEEENGDYHEKRCATLNRTLSGLLQKLGGDEKFDIEEPKEPDCLNFNIEPENITTRSTLVAPSPDYRRSFAVVVRDDWTKERNGLQAKHAAKKHKVDILEKAKADLQKDLQKRKGINSRLIGKAATLLFEINSSCRKLGKRAAEKLKKPDGK